MKNCLLPRDFAVLSSVPLPLTLCSSMDIESMFKTSPAKSEFVTRKEIVDRRLKAAGWKIIKFDPARGLDNCDRCAIEQYPTEAGPADYALCVRGEILGVVEAKKLSLGPQNVLSQAERYSKGLLVSPYNFRGFRWRSHLAP